MARPLRSIASRQRGAVLVTAIIFMLVLTMFVLAMVRSGTLEERMARNARDHQVAMEAAEAILRHAETTLFGSSPFDPYNAASFTPACTGGLCFKPAVSATWQAIDWTSADLTRTFVEAEDRLAGLDTQPRYIVEVVSPPFKSSSAAQCSPGLARITARGQGKGGATAYVQSTVRFRVFTNICD